MKALKFIGIIALILAVGVSILNMIAPKDFRIERSISINAPDKVVFDHLKNLKKMDLWSPWTEKDPNIKITYEGTDGTVGAITRWEGNDDVGTGSQEIVAIKDNERVDTKLVFLEPWQSEADAFFIMEKDGKANKVTWGFTGKSPFPENIMMMFMDMEGSVGGEYEKGLAKLKALVEGGKKYRGYDIKTIEMPEKYYAGVKERVRIGNIGDFYRKNFPKAVGAVMAKKMEMDGMPCGLYFEWNEEKKETELAATVPIKKEADFGKEIETFKVEAGQALQIDHYGAYEAIGDAHYAMDDYMKDNGLKMKSPVIEQYITDPSTEPDTMKWLTQLTYPVEKK